MFKAKWLTCALAVAAMLAVPPVAMARPAAPGPVEIAKQCIEHVTDHADRCVAFHRAASARAAERVSALVEAGHLQAARRVAQAGVKGIRKRSAACVREIAQDTRQCARLLRRMGAEGLAQRVRQAGEFQVERVRTSRKRAVLRILRELPNAEPPASEG